MEMEFQGYRLVDVYRRLDEAQRRDVADLWVSEGVLGRREAMRRADEVLFAICAPDGSLAGVNTVYVQDFMQANNPYYFMRMFMRPANRGVPGLPQFVIDRAFDFLKEYGEPGGRPKGLLIVTENQKLWSENMRRYLARLKWCYFGTGPKGNHIYIRNFDGSAPAT